MSACFKPEVSRSGSAIQPGREESRNEPKKENGRATHIAEGFRCHTTAVTHAANNGDHARYLSTVALRRCAFSASAAVSHSRSRFFVINTRRTERAIASMESIVWCSRKMICRSATMWPLTKADKVSCAHGFSSAR